MLGTNTIHLESVMSTPGDSSDRVGRQASTAYPEPVERLLTELARLPGIGRRSAERVAFHLLKATAEDAGRLARAIDDTKRSVRHCSVCFNLSSDDICGVCADPKRDRGVVMVVEQPRDLIAMEQTGQYRGLYHVLMGRISPLDGVGPEELTLDSLIERVRSPIGRQPGDEPIREVILGLNPTLEGDGTALHVMQALEGEGISVTRLARGLPSGGSLEHLSKAVLADALVDRRPV